MLSLFLLFFCILTVHAAPPHPLQDEIDALDQSITDLMKHVQDQIPKVVLSELRYHKVTMKLPNGETTAFEPIIPGLTPDENVYRLRFRKIPNGKDASGKDQYIFQTIEAVLDTEPRGKVPPVTELYEEILHNPTVNSVYQGMVARFDLAVLLLGSDVEAVRLQMINVLTLIAQLQPKYFDAILDYSMLVDWHATLGVPAAKFHTFTVVDFGRFVAHLLFQEGDRHRLAHGAPLQWTAIDHLAGWFSSARWTFLLEVLIASDRQDLAAFIFKDPRFKSAIFDHDFNEAMSRRILHANEKTLKYLKEEPFSNRMWSPQLTQLITKMIDLHFDDYDSILRDPNIMYEIEDQDFKKIQDKLLDRMFKGDDLTRFLTPDTVIPRIDGDEWGSLIYLLLSKEHDDWVAKLFQKELIVKLIPEKQFQEIFKAVLSMSKMNYWFMEAFTQPAIVERASGEQWADFIRVIIHYDLLGANFALENEMMMKKIPDITLNEIAHELSMYPYKSLYLYQSLVKPMVANRISGRIWGDILFELTRQKHTFVTNQILECSYIMARIPPTVRLDIFKYMAAHNMAPDNASEQRLKRAIRSLMTELKAQQKLINRPPWPPTPRQLPKPKPRDPGLDIQNSMARQSAPRTRTRLPPLRSIPQSLRTAHMPLRMIPL